LLRLRLWESITLWFSAELMRLRVAIKDGRTHRLSDANSWMLPNITDYIDWRNDAIQGFADMVKASPHPENDLRAIREAVSEHARVLSLQRLWTVSHIFADNIYKAGNCLASWGEEHRLYVEAAAGTFFERFSETGYVLRYFINNRFEQTDWGMQRPLYLLPRLFRAAGLVYICPEKYGLSLMEGVGIPGTDFLKEYERFSDEGRDLANELVRACNKRRKSYVVLEIGDDLDLFDAVRSDAETKVITIFRNEPPVLNSEVSVTLPRTVGLA
jgi:hypothetical protein